MESDEDTNIQIEVPTGQTRGRMGRRFTLNPLIFAKEEKEARRQSLAQLKLSYYPKHMNPESYDAGLGFCGWMFMFISWLCVLASFPISICFCIKVVQEYERAVIFRLGRLIGGGAKGPESYTKVDLRTVSFNVPPQEILTKDSVTTSVDAVVYYRVSNATISVANVENAHHSTRKDVRLPVQLQRAMAAEAEATREARAKVIAAEGEQKASRSLRDAATVIASTPAALQLRYLQTLNSVA
ncbi:unnamed protein product [Strongylus vulgaris]|uniref:Band 7 domain-containing protein n=1 Tax=Strongylus vulgaris TaxID=40348 RepID=A0A3P7IMU5_STRVU|nr:unnamed protein product [Strongylus vulgaris]